MFSKRCLLLAGTCRWAALSETAVVQPKWHGAHQVAQLRHHKLQDLADEAQDFPKCRASCQHVAVACNCNTDGDDSHSSCC